MNLLAYFGSIKDKFLQRSEFDEDITEELRSHMQHRA